MRTVMIVAAVMVAVGVAVCPAPAQDYSGSTAAAAPADEGGYAPAGGGGSAALSVLDVAGKLVIALVVAYAAIKSVRWWKDNRPSADGEGHGGRHMWLEETLSLGADGRLYLVEVEGRRMLLSARDGGVVQVAEMTEPPVRPSAYRSVRKRGDGSTDELNVGQAGVTTRSVRPDVAQSDESWEQRRGRLLAELQEQG